MAKVTIHDALEYCLANPDGLGVEELLARFPQYGEELQPLLILSSRIEEVTPPPVPAERRAAMKARLMEAAALEQAAQVAPEVPTRPVVIPAEQKRNWIWTILRRPVLVAAAMAALLVLGVWWGAAAALPDSPFYNIKLASENFMLNFAGGDADKANAHLRLANARLDEIEAMNKQSKLAAAGGAISNYREHLDRAADLRKQTAGQVEAGVKAGISTAITRFEQTFKSFGGDVAALSGPMKADIGQLYGNLSAIRVEIGEGPDIEVPVGITVPIAPGPTPGPTPGSRTPGSSLPEPSRTPTGGIVATRTPVAGGTSTRTSQVAAATGTSTPITGPSRTAAPGGTTPTIQQTSTLTVQSASTATRKVQATPTRGVTAQPTNTTQPAHTSTPTRTSPPTRTSIPGPPTRTPSAGPTLAPSRTATRTYTATYTATRTSTHVVPTQIEPSPTSRPPVIPTRTPPDPPHPTPHASTGVPPERTSMPTHAPPQPSNTHVPPRPNTRVPSTAIVEPTEPTNTSCDLRIEELEVEASCELGGGVDWVAEVENESSTAQEGNWEAVLKIKTLIGPYIEVARMSGRAIFQPNQTTQIGNSFLHGVIFPNTKMVRVELTVTQDGRTCDQKKIKDKECDDR